LSRPGRLTSGRLPETSISPKCATNRSRRLRAQRLALSSCTSGEWKCSSARSPWALTRTTATARGLLVTVGSLRSAGTLRPLEAFDPTGEKARGVKVRYVGVCRGCGAYTQPRNGKGDAYAYCKACHPGAIEQRWTRERVVEAMLDWRRRYGRLPSSYDWSRTHARRRGGEARERVSQGEWPPASIVTDLFGTWAAARVAAVDRAETVSYTSTKQAPASETDG
jgi:hypothetical protein